MPRNAFTFFTAFAVGLLSSITLSRSAFPEKPITILYPWAPRAPSETVLIALGEAVSKELGQPVVIRNVRGDNGKNSVVEAARAPADGYTLLNNWISPQIAGRMSDPNDPFRNAGFIPIAGLFAVPFAITVAADNPASNVAEFIRWSKAKGGKLNFGVCDAYSAPHQLGERFMRSAGLEFNPIPNAAGCMGDNMTGLLNGTLDVSVGLVPAVKTLAGQVKHIALIGDTPHPSAPGLLTSKEQGVKIGWGDAALGRGGLVAPVGTPYDRVAILRAALKKVIESEEFKTALGPLRDIIKYASPPEFKALWAGSLIARKFSVDELVGE